MKSLFTCFLAALAASFLILPLSSCTKHDDGNLNVMYHHLRDEVKSLDPQNAYDVVSAEVIFQIYETLYQYDYLATDYKLVPLLAADLPRYSKDGLTVTIPIRKDVQFANDAKAFKANKGKGRLLTANDFVTGFKRLAWPGIDSQGWWVVDNKIVGINAFHDKLVAAKSKEEAQKLFWQEKVEGVQALDDHTLQLKLTKPYPQLLYVLTLTFTSPVAREAMEAYADEKGNLTDNPVGTGPFVLKSWERGRRIVLERNPDFHPEFYPTTGAEEFRKKGLLADAGKKLPFLDKIVMDIIRETQPRWLNFLKGDLDSMTIPKDNFAQAITNRVNLSPELTAKGMRLNTDAGVGLWFIEFNMKDKILGPNKYLRQALSSAISREKWIEIFTNDTGIKMVNALPPGTPDRPTNSKIKYDFDLAKAKELMKKAGYPNGEGLPVLNFDLRGSNSAERQRGEFFAQQWAQIGVKINPIYNTFPAYLEKARQGNLQIAYGGWSMDFPDAENMFQLLYGPNKAPGANEANYDVPEMNRYYEQISTLERGPKRAAIIQKADDLLQEDCPWALGYYETTYTLAQPWLQNFRQTDLNFNRFKYWRVDKEIKARYKKGS